MLSPNNSKGALALWHSKLILCTLNWLYRQCDLAGLKDVVKSYAFGRATAFLEKSEANIFIDFYY